MKNSLSTFKLTDVRTYSPFEFAFPLNLTMEQGEHWIIYGENGIGKTILVDTIRGCFRVKKGSIDYHFNNKTSNRISANIHYITFHDQYGNSNEPTCYQLRWNQGLLENTSPTVGDILHDLYQQDNDELRNVLQLDALKDKQVIMLSSGEFRRFQIAKILLEHPSLLIVDNPYIGLDAYNRQQVSLFFNRLIEKGHTQIILVACNKILDISHFTHIIKVECDHISKIPIKDTNSNAWELTEGASNGVIRNIHEASEDISEENEESNRALVTMNDITIRYGNHTILSHINWNVERGEKWSLEGENGSGKSTLLSLINADNPQAYACNITLFGKKRGTGESIWDIKKNIGYVCPEMYRNYHRPIPVKDIVASGLYDSLGFYKTYTETDYEKISFWLQLFGIDHLTEKSYLNISSGEQRIVLLARAFVKDPTLLILDEPFHGLDDRNKQRAMSIIEEFCQRKDKSLIFVSHYKEDYPTCITHYLNLSKN